LAIPPALALRVQTDAAAPDYWYIPKGQAVSTDNWPRIADQLAVLSNFQTVPWAEAQPKFAAELLARGLIEPLREHESGFSAVARMQFPVWRLLGLAWINKRGQRREPEITDVGRCFVELKTEAERRQLLTMQLHRYQFFNPSSAAHFSTFRTFPLIALYRLLSQTDWHLDWDEFKLFGTRIRDFSDADELATIVGQWREVTDREREQLLAIAQTIRAKHTKSKEGTTWGKVDRDLAYTRAVLRITSTLLDGQRGIGVSRSNRRRVQRLVYGATASAEFVDYTSEQDWLAVYGQLLPKERWDTPWSTATDARSYYEQIGRIEAATEAFRREQASRPPLEIEEYRRIQVLEKVLEDILEHNLEALESGLRLVGRQYPTAIGTIDLLAQDATGIYVVIELKRGRTGDRVVGQIARYLTWVAQRLARGQESRVRGIVVGENFDNRFRAAITQLRRVSSYTFDLRVSFEKWPAAERSRQRRRNARSARS